MAYIYWILSRHWKTGCWTLIPFWSTEVKTLKITVCHSSSSGFTVTVVFRIFHSILHIYSIYSTPHWKTGFKLLKPEGPTECYKLYIMMSALFKTVILFTNGWHIVSSFIYLYYKNSIPPAFLIFWVLMPYHPRSHFHAA